MEYVGLLCDGVAGDALGTLTCFLEFEDFLKLSATSRCMREFLLSREKLWGCFFERNAVSCNRPDTLDILTGKRRECRCQYRIRPFSESINGFKTLADLASQCGLVDSRNKLDGAALLHLAISSDRHSRKVTVDRDIVRDLRTIGKPLVAVSRDGVGWPFAVLSTNRILGIGTSREFFDIGQPTPISDKHMFQLVACCWVRSIQCPRCSCGGGGCGDKTPRKGDDEEHVNRPLALAMLYTCRGQDPCVSVYTYGKEGLERNPPVTWKIPAGDDAVTCLEVVQGRGCDHYFAFVGTDEGFIHCIQAGAMSVIANTRSPIEVITAAASGDKMILCVHAAGDILVMHVEEDIKRMYRMEEASIYAIDTENLVLVQCNYGKCTLRIGRFAGFDEYISVTKPPSFILYLHRRSLWALVIRNYVKLIQVFGRGNDLRVKHLRILNGHTADITACHADGWSRMVTVDAAKILIVWDFIRGVKVIRLSLITASACMKLPKPSRKGSDKNARKRRSVNSDISYASLHNVKKDFNNPPPATYGDDSSDNGDQIVHGMERLCTRPSPTGDKQTVYISLDTVCIYYHQHSYLQVVNLR
ncbi:RNA polymerase Rpb1 C-terminal repeat-containing protein, putative [Babesia ovata]|uniref:RNA polymerase Rpb1 C-terminal repeat-containing protein, putative n=1 Tax=Babesia ovata TaxID=189622 RepID=A0A2H6KB77_9APIC|nr:RNA polymerase Rpb1 C-terminal repeat-containing protein, putative [Babesia ovata]GBE60245.1 RNA polymerase Rpb1 C-terminal repeat-containing protein, putative [Babesia ovata]